MLFTLLISLSLFLSVVTSSPTIVADERIQDINITPELGRGYSTSTNEVLSTCLIFKGKTLPTYNFKYDFMEVDYSGTSINTYQGEFHTSLSWGFIQATVNANMKASEQRNVTTHHVITKMKMERYYSSLDDRHAELAPEAKDLLSSPRYDTVGFFQACGGGFIRSIRRTAEVTAIFELSSTNVDSVMSAAADLQVKVFGMNIGGGSLSIEDHSLSSDTHMKIKIIAFGIGLNDQGANTLVARDFDDYKGAMDYAFKSMQNDDVGMIQGIEVVPWVENLQFQAIVNFVPIEEVKPAENITGKNISINPAGKKIPPLILKSIAVLNAEFITMIDSFYRGQINYLHTMAQCLGQVLLLWQNPSYQYLTLLDHTKTDFKPPEPEDTVRLSDLHDVITYENYKTKLSNVTFFITTVYGPCIEKINSFTNNGRMTKYYWDIPECNPQCTFPLQVIGKNATSGLADCSQHGDKDPATANTKVLAIYSMDQVITKFCLPQFDHSNRTNYLA